MTDDDSHLLSAYVREGSEAAFGELVRRHLTLVYAAALRQTDGDAHRARDIAQIVFTTLARNAASLSRHPALTGWLYTATRHTAIDLMRSERRRQKREEEAMTMQEISSGSEMTADWEQLRPVLDTAMDELDERDREAVLLRFFENRPFAGVASALRVSEDAARKRVDRALARLGEALARRGIASTGGALGLLLANEVAVAAPAGVASSITAAALAGAGAATGGIGAGAAGIFIMSTTKTVTGIAAVVAALAIGTAFYQAKVARDAAAAAASLRGERDELGRRLAALDQRARQADESLAATQQELGALRASAAQPASSSGDTPGSQGATMDYLLEHPEMHAAFLAQQELRGKMRYDRFLQTSGLSAGQQDQVLNVLNEARAGEVDLMAALHARGYGVGNVPQDPEGRAMLQKMATEMKQRLDTGLRSTLGDDGYKAFQQYSALIPERNVADQLASQLYYTTEPLTPAQADQLVRVLAQNRFASQPSPAPAAMMNGNFIDPPSYSRRLAQEMQQNGMNLLGWSAPVTDTALSRAETVLTPGQLAALRQVQVQQVLQFQLAPPPVGQKAPAESK